MRIAERLLSPSPCFSFEFFPPKTPAGVGSLMTALHELRELEPGFVSVTYGAGGSTQALTAELVGRIKRETGIEAMAHLTCVGHDRAELGLILDRLAAEGIENVLALRGDAPRPPPPPQPPGSPPVDALPAPYEPAPGGFRYAEELTRFIKTGHLPGEAASPGAGPGPGSGPGPGAGPGPDRVQDRDRNRWRFCLGGACYPEGHVECPSRDDDLKHLVRKVEAGAEFLITQLFFDNAFYFDFVQRAQAARIRVPILPGIMPITSFEQVDRFTRMCGATIPMRLRQKLERNQHDPNAVLELGVAHATVQCIELLQRGAPGVHFYTLNRSKATRMIVSALRANRF